MATSQGPVPAATVVSTVCATLGQKATHNTMVSNNHGEVCMRIPLRCRELRQIPLQGRAIMIQSCRAVNANFESRISNRALHTSTKVIESHALIVMHV